MWSWIKRIVSGGSSWSDDEREELFETLDEQALGEVRLRKHSPEEIQELLFEVCVGEEAPKAEHRRLREFVAERIRQHTERLTSDSAAWPEVTDCDRLDEAEASLLEAGIMLWQASPCCDTCTSSELPDRIDHLEESNPGIGKKLRGYAFFIDQTLPESLAESEGLSLYLAYGWFNEDESVSSEEYERGALAIGHEVVEHLERAGLSVDWNGDFAKKIGVAVTWQRRTRLI